MFIGILYQYFSVRKEGKLYIPSGRVVDVGHTQLHYYGEGEPSPTVVFDCGHGVSLSNTDWSLVQPEVAKQARTIVYDRAGMGLSKKSKKPRTSEQIVEELHSLLVNSGEEAPYLLVGHSLGALNMCLFAHKYSEKVAGIVLIDGGSVDCYRNYFKTPTLLMMTSIMMISIVLNKMGVFRILGKIGFIPHINERKRKLSDENSKLDESFFYRHYSNGSMLREAWQLQRSVEQLSKVASIGNIPLTVITAGETEKVYKGWIKSQKTLLSLSTNSSHIILEKSGHFIHLEHPDVVNEVIKNMINNLSTKTNAAV